MILEGLVTSLNAQGEVNIAPMGPIVDESMTSLQLRPFRTSQTYRNLKQHPAGVFHVVDDVGLLARGAIGKLTSAELPPLLPALHIRGQVVQSACRWYEFVVDSLDDLHERCDIRCRVVHMGWLRDFFGFNRAKHAVLEAAILATRLHILPRETVLAQFDALQSPVDKTAGPAERDAFRLLQDYVAEYYRPPDTTH